MKKFIVGTLCVIIAFVAGILGAWGYSEVIKPKIQDNAQEEIINPALEYETCSNVRFLTPGEVMEYYETVYDYQYVDSVFLSIPYETLETIAKVTTGRSELGATKKEIVFEYLQHYNNIYKYIDPQAQEPSQPDPPIERIEEKMIDSTNYDTIINGKPYKKIEQ